MMNSNKMTLVESMAAMRKQLHDIDSKQVDEAWLGNIGNVAGAGMDALAMGGKAAAKWAFGKSSKEIAKEIGQRVETIAANGEKQVWQAKTVGNDVVYELEGVGTKIPAEDLATMKPKNIETDMRDPVLKMPTAEKPRVKVNPGETQDQAMKRAAEKGEIKQVDVSGADPLHPKRIEPTMFKNVEAAKAAADAELKAGSVVVKTPDNVALESVEDVSAWIGKSLPGVSREMSANPEKTKKFWEWFTNPKTSAKSYPPGSIRSKLPSDKPSGTSKKQKAIVIGIIALLALLGFLQTTKKNPTGGGSGSSGSEDGSAPIGTVIPADEMPWKWVATGSTNPNVVIKNANVPGGYDSLKSQSVTKNESGKWQTPNGNVLNANGPTAARLEQLAKMDPEKRKEMARAEKSVIDNSVEMWPAGSLPDDKVTNPNNTPELPPVGSEVTTNTTPDITTKPDIVIGKDDAEKTKKKKDEKVLPSSKW